MPGSQSTARECAHTMWSSCQSVSADGCLVCSACQDPTPASSPLHTLGEPKGGDSAFATPLAKTSCDLQLDLIEAQEVEVMDVEFEADEALPSDLLTSEEDERDAFILPVEAKQPPTNAVSTAGKESRLVSTAPSTSGPLDMCKRAAARLEIPWPLAVAVAPRVRYKGNTLSLARSAAKQPLQ